MVVDLFLVFQFIRKLVTPYNNWPAFEQGIIDDQGNILIKRKQFTKKAQRQAFGVFDQMILNIKKLLAKLPGGASRLGSYAAALWLIKEYKTFSDENVLNESHTDEDLNLACEGFEEWYLNYVELEEATKDEEAPANNVGSGNIAGMDGNHMSKAAQKRHKKRTLKSFKETAKEIK